MSKRKDRHAVEAATQLTELGVTGMHCSACEVLVQDAVSEDPLVVSARIDRRKNRLWVSLPSGIRASDQMGNWNSRLEPLGYQILERFSPPAGSKRWETAKGLALGVAFLTLFALLQASGIVTVFAPESLEVSGAFVLGILASFSSCFALVGGMLVSYTASVGRTHPRLVVPGLTAFHLTRVVVFSIGGGILGWLGTAIVLSPDWSRGLLTGAALVMSGLGLNLLGVRLPRLSAGGSMGLARQWATWGSVSAGALLGAATFFLPCGFTQSVQFQALASGGFAEGALLMLAFVLGTLPVLLGVGWFLRAGLKKTHKKLLLAAGGTVVLGLGLFQLWGALRLWGLRI